MTVPVSAQEREERSDERLTLVAAWGAHPLIGAAVLRVLDAADRVAEQSGENR